MFDQGNRIEGMDLRDLADLLRHESGPEDADAKLYRGVSEDEITQIQQTLREKLRDIEDVMSILTSGRVSETRYNLVIKRVIDDLVELSPLEWDIFQKIRREEYRKKSVELLRRATEDRSLDPVEIVKTNTNYLYGTPSWEIKAVARRGYQRKDLASFDADPGFG